MKNKLTISLDQFIDREFMLSGVDYDTEELDDVWVGNANVVRFMLDGVVFNALENPSDGYRSMLDEVYMGGSISTHKQFTPIKVKGEWMERRAIDKVVQMRDMKTDKIVLEFGTKNVDDYYPCYVANHKPENMCINQ